MSGLQFRRDILLVRGHAIGGFHEGGVWKAFSVRLLCQGPDQRWIFEQREWPTLLGARHLTGRQLQILRRHTQSQTSPARLWTARLQCQLETEGAPQGHQCQNACRCVKTGLQMSHKGLCGWLSMTPTRETHIHTQCADSQAVPCLPVSITLLLIGAGWPVALSVEIKLVM